MIAEGTAARTLTHVLAFDVVALGAPVVVVILVRRVGSHGVNRCDLHDDVFPLGIVRFVAWY